MFILTSVELILTSGEGLKAVSALAESTFCFVRVRPCGIGGVNGGPNPLYFPKPGSIRSTALHPACTYERVEAPRPFSDNYFVTFPVVPRAREVRKTHTSKVDTTP